MIAMDARRRYRRAGLSALALAAGGAVYAQAARAGNDAAAEHVVISAFRASTADAVDAWVAQPGFYPLPARTAVFPAGTTQIGFTFLFKGAVPHVTAEQVVVRGPYGLRVTSGRPRVLQHATNGIYEYLSSPGLAYPNGHYTAVVLIDGKQAAQTSFAID